MIRVSGLTRRALGSFIAAGLIGPAAAHAQWVGSTREAYMPASHNAAFRSGHPVAARVSNLFDYQQAVRYEALWTNPGARAAALEETEFARWTQLLNDPPGVDLDVTAVASSFVRLVPETDALLHWGHLFRRQVLDVLADEESSEAERDGKMSALVANYRSEIRLAVSAAPKSLNALDAQTYSLEFRQRYPKYSGLGWAARWMQAGLYESLLTQSSREDGTTHQDALVDRLKAMVRGAPQTTPYLLPLTAAVAPTFSRRYPEAAAILDNLSMLEESVADVLVSREIPRSAKRLEILRVAERFRSDTAYALDNAQWLTGVARIGVNNMGGEAVGFTSALAIPTVPRGASMAGLMAVAPPVSDMAGMDHGSTQALPTAQSLMEIHQRMMSDPVIRERAATDPVLTRMLNALPTGTAASMEGMQHTGMPGMPTTVAGAASLMSGTPEQRQMAMEFVVRLLSDPAVEARIHAYPELHALWSDPDVQRRLTELKRTAPVKR